MKQYDFKEIYELSRTQEVKDLCWEIANKLFTISINRVDAIGISTVATLVLGLKEGDKGYEKVRSFVEFVFPGVQSHQVWGTFSDERFLKLDERLLLAVILASDSDANFSKYNQATPVCVSELILKLLNIEDGNKVADLCCNTGSFLVKTKANYPNVECYGCDIGTYDIAELKLKESYFPGLVRAEEKNVFDLEDIEFDRIFMNHPFGWRLIDNKEASAFVKKYYDGSRTCFSDWAFVLKALELLKENGKLVTIVSNGCLYSGLDKAFRKMIVDKRYIETIISLPENLFGYTSISATVLVLSKKNNEKIRLVDATDLYVKNRRKNALQDVDIELIVNSVANDSDISRVINVDEIATSDYSLVPARYIDRDLTKFENGVQFDSVITNIFRGAPITSAELDELSTNEETDYQYLMLSNIKGGIIDEKLPYLSKVDDKYKKYCIKNRSLLISKNGAPFKLAVAEIESGRNVIANGNLYVVELDENKVDPFYLQAFFMSKAGQQLLNKFVVGAAIPNLPVNNLKTAIIPLPDLKTQKKIAMEYSSIVDEINLLTKKIEKAKDKLSNCFDEASKEA